MTRQEAIDRVYQLGEELLVDLLTAKTDADFSAIDVKAEQFNEFLVQFFNENTDRDNPDDDHNDLTFYFALAREWRQTRLKQGSELNQLAGGYLSDFVNWLYSGAWITPEEQD